MQQYLKERMFSFGSTAGKEIFYAKSVEHKHLPRLYVQLSRFPRIQTHFDIVFRFSSCDTSAVLLLISIAVAIDARGFSNLCPNPQGRNNKPFKILKFRTILKSAPAEV